MYNGKDFRVIILGCSLLLLITWHAVAAINILVFGNTRVIQEKWSIALVEPQVAPEEQCNSGPSDTANAPFNYSKLHINCASVELLKTIPGIGSALAGRIVEFRVTNGDFSNFDSLMKVSGVGRGKAKTLKQYTWL